MTNNMKVRNIIASLLLGSVVFASCGEKISTPNTANKGKEKPTVGIELKDNSDVDFTLTLTLSDDILSYGYVIYAADTTVYATIPSAFDIVKKSVPGAFASGAAIKGDETTVDLNFKCVLKEYYQICTAAISKDGLLSEVDTLTVYIEGAHPEITFVNAKYKITPYTKEELGDDAHAACPGTPFEVSVLEVAPSVYVTDGAWFGLANIPLVGTYDYSDNTLTFDGTEYGYEADGSIFGGLYSYIDRTVPLALAVFGGGSSGTDPLVFQCTVADKKATITSIKSGALDFSVYNGSSGSWQYAGLFGFFDEDCTIEFVEEVTEEE